MFKAATWLLDLTLVPLFVVSYSLEAELECKIQIIC